MLLSTQRLKHFIVHVTVSYDVSCCQTQRELGSLHHPKNTQKLWESLKLYLWTRVNIDAHANITDILIKHKHLQIQILYM